MSAGRKLRSLVRYTQALGLGPACLWLFACGGGIPPSSEVTVVGGRPVDRGSWPAVVALAEDQRAFCTGAVIAPRFVLTAGHCVKDYTEVGGLVRPLSYLQIMTGDGGDKTLAPQRVINVHMRPYYAEHPMGAADQALLELDGPLLGVEPLAFASTWVEGRRLAKAPRGVIIGYGRSEDGSAGEKTEAHVEIGTTMGEEITVGGNGPDACDGDSGAPVVIDQGMDVRPVVLATTVRGKSYQCGMGSVADLTWPAACWIRSVQEPAVVSTHTETNDDDEASDCGPAPHYQPAALATLTWRKLCEAASPSQSETMAAVAEALGSRSCGEAGEMLATTTFLDLSGRGLRDLSPLVRSPKLERLNLTGNRLKDAAVLVTLPALREVQIDGNDIRDLSMIPTHVHVRGAHRQLYNHAATPFLRDCLAKVGVGPAVEATVRAVLWTTMTDNCRIANQRLLATQTLNLSGFGLVDVSSLAFLPLKSLDLSRNKRLFVKPLTTLEDLSFLDLTATSVVDGETLVPQMNKGLRVIGMSVPIRSLVDSQLRGLLPREP